MMRSRRGLASGRVELVFKVVIPVFGVGEGMLRRGGRIKFGPRLERMMGGWSSR